MDDLKPFDFGNLTPQDLERVWGEFGNRGYGKLSVNHENMAAGASFGQFFLSFLSNLFQKLGLMDSHMMVNPRLGINGVSANPKATEFLRDVWNFRAEDWAIVESPHAYLVTIQTLMEFIKGAGKDKEEYILSLGSGPGLYETFLALLFRKVKITKRTRFICLDGAPEMSKWHKKILRTAVEAFGEEDRLRTVRILAGDMTALPLKSNSVQQIICNNALQWVPEWQKAIQEMSRVLDPNALGYLYLFVHLHPMGLRVIADNGEVFNVESGRFTLDELLDTLEANRFVIHHMRQIGGRKGTGQFGARIDRAFVLAKYQAEGERKSWREKKIQSNLSVLST